MLSLKLDLKSPFCLFFFFKSMHVGTRVLVGRQRERRMSLSGQSRIFSIRLSLKDHSSLMRQNQSHIMSTWWGVFLQVLSASGLWKKRLFFSWTLAVICPGWRSPSPPLAAMPASRSASSLLVRSWNISVWLGHKSVGISLSPWRVVPNVFLYDPSTFQNVLF